MLPVLLDLTASLFHRTKKREGRKAAPVTREIFPPKGNKLRLRVSFVMLANSCAPLSTKHTG